MIGTIRLSALFIFAICSLFGESPKYSTSELRQSSIYRASAPDQLLQSKECHHIKRGKHGKRGPHGKHGHAGRSTISPAVQGTLTFTFNNFIPSGSTGTFQIFIYAPDGSRYTDGATYDASAPPTSATITVSPSLLSGPYIVTFFTVTTCTNQLFFTMNTQNTANSNVSQVFESVVFFPMLPVGSLIVASSFGFP